MKVLELSDLQIKKGYEIGDLKMAVRTMTGNYEEVVITPTSEAQERVPSVGKDAISKVTVEAIPSQYIDPSDTTATADTVTEGKTFYDASGQKVVGTRGADMLQARVDAAKSGAYLFHYYEGDNLDFAKDLDISNVTDMSSAFSNCKNVKDFSVIENWDWRSVTKANSLFSNCRFTEAPDIDISNIEEFLSGFYNCYNMTSMPQYNLSKAKKLSNCFYGCYALKEIPLIDTSGAEEMSQFFGSCTKLEVIPQLNTSKVKSFSNFAMYCYALKIFPALDTKNATSMGSMFSYCSALVTVELIDMRSLTNGGANYMFSGCSKLTNLNLKNVTQSLQIGSGTSWGHLLTLDSLINTVQELWTDTASRTLTMATASKEKLASVYVKLVDITDEMRAQDEFIDKKLPFAVCESTDEGAMLITDYVKLKNWTIA